MTASPPARPIRAVTDDTEDGLREGGQIETPGDVLGATPDERFNEGSGEDTGDDSGENSGEKSAEDMAERKEAAKAAKAERAARREAQLEARKAAVAAAKAEAQAALQARQEARALSLGQRNERQLAKVEAEAAREEAVRNAPAPVKLARPKARHYGIITSFVFMVLLPVALTGWYLWERATDQYASHVGFSVRTEEQGSSIESLFGVSDISGSSTSDTDILYEFLQGQQLVALVDAQLDLREIWSRPGVEADPVFSYDPPGTIEDLTDHWGKKVKIYYESNSGLLDLRVLAFDPVEAQQIAQVIYDESSDMINRLSAIAREDAISYARDELEQAQEQLKQARLDIQDFRNRTQIVDPTLQTQTQTGIISALEQELANAQIDLQLLRDTARATDPRIAQSELRIAAIKRQIAEERSELGIEGENSDTSVADLVGQYETLAVDLQFAEEAYTAARANYDASVNEARRKSRYLAAHVPPTLAEKSLYPERESTLGLIALFLFMAWAFLVLVVYAMRDRR